MLMLGYNLNDFSFTYSYDQFLTESWNNFMIHEISVSYKFKNEDKAAKRKGEKLVGA